MAQQTAVDWLYEQMSDKQPNWLYVIDTKEYVQKLWEQAKAMENEQRGYTKQEFLDAAKLGEVSMIDARHIVSLLDEVRELNSK